MDVQYGYNGIFAMQQEALKSGARFLSFAAAIRENHPKWYHMSRYAKKKRIRKKYRDKIKRMNGCATDIQSLKTQLNKIYGIGSCLFGVDWASGGYV